MGMKNFKIEIRLSKEDFDKLQSCVQTHYYLSPYDEDVRMGFNSRAEYIEYLIKTTNELVPEQWKYFAKTYGTKSKFKAKNK